MNLKRKKDKSLREFLIDIVFNAKGSFIKIGLILLILAQAVPAAAGEASSPKNYFLEFYIFQIFGFMAVLTFASKLYEMRGTSKLRIRLGWNWILLLSFSTCLFTGFALLVPMDRSLSSLMMKFHIWTGAICCWAGLHHAAGRMRAMVVRRSI